MTSAFVLVNAELGREEEVLGKLQSLNPVKEAHIVYGEYDIILKVEAEDQKTPKDSLFSEIRKLGGIRSTLTMVVIIE
jgi:DNA-binding Lrp family transcriptional regulator